MVIGRNEELRYNCTEADIVCLSNPESFCEINVINKVRWLDDFNFENLMVFEPTHEDQEICF